MVRKVTISLPDELAERIDAEAGLLGVSRSELVQEASAQYLSMTAEQRVAEERRRRGLAAIEDMKRIAAKPPLDSRTALEILREVRDTDDSAPLWKDRAECTDPE